MRRFYIQRALLLLLLALMAAHAAHAMSWKLPFCGVHRGGAAWRPEHSLDTYREALATWSDCLLECDAQLTKDGIVVLHHDATVDRTTEGAGPIAEMTLAEVKALDAGYDFTPDGGQSFPFRGKGLTIATLDELLTAFPMAHVLIEFKDGVEIVPAVVDVLKKHDAESRVLVASFEPATMDEVKRVMPDVARCFNMASGMRLLGALRGEAWDAYVPEDHVLALGVRMVQQFQLTPEEITRLREKGVVVQLYDIDTEPLMHKALELGVDAVLTDRPDLLAEVIESNASKPGSN